MTKTTSSRKTGVEFLCSTAFIVLVLLFISLLFSSQYNWGASQVGEKQPGSSGIAAMKARAQDMSITVFPVNMGGKGFKNVAEVLALMLEKSNVKKIEVSEHDFTLPQENDMQHISDSFGDFVREKKIGTDYALFGQFIATPEAGFKEVRTIVVDKKGDLVWADSQTADDELFKSIKPNEPMLCCYLLVKSLSETLGLPDMEREGAPEGEWAAYGQKQSGTPQKSEQSSIEALQKTMHTNFARSRVTVFPVLLQDRMSSENAKNIAALLQEKKLCTAQVASQEVSFNIEPNSSEQKMLWDLARKFQEYVKEKGIDTDYALYAQYFISPRDGKVMAVHSIICNKSGELTVVDFQNDHHDDFNAIAPASASDCDKLLLRRIEGYLK